MPKTKKERKEMITWITENIAIGEYIDACNRELLEREKIDCILCLRTVVSNEEDVLKEFLGIPLFHISIGDHQGLEPIRIELRAAVHMLIELAEVYHKILVHCTACFDRTPFVVACYIAHTEYFQLHDIKYQMEEGYKDVREKRPNIIEHYEWV